MNHAERTAWRATCRTAGMDPEEVAMVAERYAAYRDFATGPGALALEGWFRFYRLEKQSELADNAQGVASACTATGDGNPHQYLSRPGPFLDLVRAYLALKDTPAAAAKSL